MSPELVFSGAATDRVRRTRAVLLIACFHIGLVILFLPIPGAGRAPGWAMLLTALLLNLLFAPLEYALGVLGFAFLAASTEGLAEMFATLRWVYLGAAVVILAVRFFFRQSPGRRAAFNSFDYLMVVFLVVAAVTAFDSLAARLSAVKLAAMVGVFYVFRWQCASWWNSMDRPPPAAW